MSEKPTDNEINLAKKVIELDESATRPVIPGGDPVSAATNFVLQRVTKGTITAIVFMIILYQGWMAFNSSKQLVADLQRKRAEVGEAQADAVAVNKRIGEQTTAQRTLEAELQKTKADADAAQAEAEAATHSVDGVPARLAQLQAELQQKQAEAKDAKAEADAALQEIDGIPMALAQKQAEVAAAWAKAKSAVANVRLMTHLDETAPKILDGSEFDSEKLIFGK
jgi:septal ring factor EnvC (AmiA/AmiB activator)